MIPIGRPRLGCLSVLSILVVILAALLFIQTPNEYTNSDGIVHQLDESSNPLNGKNALDSTVSTESEPLSKGQGTKKAVCTLAKVNKPPSLPIFLTFPILRECKEVNILERILSKVRSSFSILLLESDYGEKVDTILDEPKSSIKDANRVILTQWLKGKGRKPVTWRTLIDILNSVELRTLATDIEGSCEPSVLDIPTQSYPFGHVMQLAETRKKVYRRLNPVEPSQKLLNNLGDISFDLPFVMPQLSSGIDFNDVLAELEIGSRLLVTGRPGVGKSTLTRYAAKMWANTSLLHHCQLLIRVPLYDTIDTLETLLVKYLGCKETLVGEEIENSNGEGVCFLLDSFDEYRGNHRQDFILNLLKSGSEYHVLPNSTIIMTSRPEAVNDIRKYFNRAIEISGFDSQHVYSYISQLRSPENETIAATLVKNPNAELMCFTPLHLTMMVRLAYNYTLSMSRTALG